MKTPNPLISAFLKNLPVKVLGSRCYLSEAPLPFQVFVFGVVKQFCGFGIWSSTQYITAVYALHTTRSPPPRYTPYDNIHTPVLIHTGEGEGGEVRGALVHMRGRKYQHDCD
jgi:hypothetical protein